MPMNADWMNRKKDRIVFPPSDDKGYPFKASYDSYGSEDVTAIAKQALLYDQPGMKLIFVSCAQKSRIIYRSDAVYRTDCFPKKDF